MRTALAAALVSILTIGIATASERRDNDVERIQTASVVLKQIMDAPDSAIPDSIMSGAKCLAIMPSMLKGGFIIGANYGKGVATCRTEKGWSAPAFFKLTGGSFGFQAGGQASDLVLIIRTDDGMQHLLSSKFKLGADASAAAGPVGRDAQAATDLTLRAQVLTYSRSRGLFLGVSLGGGVINQDGADTTAFYGKGYTYRAILNGQVPPPKDAQVLLNTVERYAPTPRRHVAPAAAATPRPAEPAQTSEVPKPAQSALTAQETKPAGVSSADEPASEEVAHAAPQTQDAATSDEAEPATPATPAQPAAAPRAGTGGTQ